MKKLTFRELAERILKEEKCPLSAEEIWELAVKKGYDKECATTGKTPWSTLGARIYVDMRDNPNSQFVKVGTHPVRFTLHNLLSEEDLEKIEYTNIAQTTKTIGYRERELHSFLTYYARVYMNVHTKTIFHEKSNKKKYSQWLHPDIVGISFPSWGKKVLDLSKIFGNPNVLFYSFELKKEINFSNLRETFFQAVSNSSWANEGYLVAAEVSDDKEFREELRRLSNSFGIGVIKLELEDPDSSNILYPARRKSELDWETMNKLYKENPDFRNFITGVYNDISINEPREERYDKFIDTEELVKKLKTKFKY